MSINERQIDLVLASALRGAAAAWPSQWGGSACVDVVLRRIRYHGVAGLLADAVGDLDGWPIELILRIRERAKAQTMWELRHRVLLSQLLCPLKGAGIVAILLKGTAIAYDLYPSPATRARSDSDLLIAPAALDLSRSIFQQLGFRRETVDAGARDGYSSQEEWTIVCDGGIHHHIDLHWELLNSPALKDLLPFEECSSHATALPRLWPQARAMERVHTLIHTCVHRAMHFTAPYFADGVAHYGGDRLIWAKDIDLLVTALSDADWTSFCALAQQKGISAVCFDGFMMAQRFLGTDVPRPVLERLSAASGDAPASAYLLHSRPARRAWLDFKAVPGLRGKFAYARALGLPSAAFMRRKYPKMSRTPLPILYARRALELFRPSLGQSVAR